MGQQAGGLMPTHPITRRPSSLPASLVQAPTYLLQYSMTMCSSSFSMNES